MTKSPSAKDPFDFAAHLGKALFEIFHKVAKAIDAVLDRRIVLDIAWAKMAPGDFKIRLIESGLVERQYRRLVGFERFVTHGLSSG
jgi:hypothetical protein